MASFPSHIFGDDNIKIRYLEEFASEALDQRFLGLPLGVYEGYDVSFVSPNVTLATGSRGFSLARVLSALGKVSIDIFSETDITLDFTGHDFDASGDIYVVAKANYLIGSPTTAQFITQNAAPIGDTEIGLCRVTGTGVGTVTGVFFDTPPDRYTPLANAFNDFGFMSGGSVEALASLIALSGNCEIDTTVQSGGFSPIASQVGRVFILDMGAIGTDEDILLPPSAGLTEGDTFGFFSISGVPSAFEVGFVPDGTDLISYNGALTTKAFMRKFIGHFVSFTLVTTGLGVPTWLVKAHTLKTFHGSDHELGGPDAIKLDDLAEPDDNTDLDATAARHGLLPKLSGSAADLFRGDGTFGPAPQPSIFVYDPIVYSGAGPHPIIPDGRIHRISLSGGPLTLDFPDSTLHPDGAIARIQVDFPLIAAPPEAVTLSAFGVDRICIPGSQLSILPITLTFKAESLEFVLDKSASLPATWKLRQFTRPPKHGPLTHHAGGDDEMDVTALGGFPGGGTLFLRDDGTFALPVNVNEVYGAVSSLLGSPMNWNIVNVNQPALAYTLVGGTQIEVPSAGHYIVAAMGNGIGTGGSVTINKGGVPLITGHGNGGVGGAWSATPVIGISVAVPAAERFTVTHAGVNTNASIYILKVR